MPDRTGPLGRAAGTAAPAAAASALAFAVLQAVEQVLLEYRSSAPAWLDRTQETEAEAQRAYNTEQGTARSAPAPFPNPPRT
ncbi:hypothetical protein [Streptomyces sp. NPDC052496]|uniref:hypothetical protein n=1 Tax=Streptomyces sp. NPDC052496 TaxID=3154951 RepID=UPI003429232E